MCFNGIANFPFKYGLNKNDALFLKLVTMYQLFSHTGFSFDQRN